MAINFVFHHSKASLVTGCSLKPIPPYVFDSKVIIFFYCNKIIILQQTKSCFDNNGSIITMGHNVTLSGSYFFGILNMSMGLRVSPERRVSVSATTPSGATGASVRAPAGTLSNDSALRRRSCI